MARILEGRDPNYQKLAVKGLIGNSKRVLQATKNEEKIQSIKEGVQILEDFLEAFDRENRGSENMVYLAVDIVKAFTPKDKLAAEFVEVYEGKAKGRYEFLRTLHPKHDDSKSWDIVRNEHLAKIRNKIKDNQSKLFNDDGSPTNEHLELIQWAFSPSADKLKTNAEQLKNKTQKRKSSDDGKAVSEKKKRS